MKTVLDIHKELMPGVKLYYGTTQISGPCPFCGCGDDRFAMYLNRGECGTGRWTCRKCPPPPGHKLANGDAVDMYRKACGMGYREARRAVGLPDNDGRGREGGFSSARRSSQGREAENPQVRTPSEARMPPAAWSEQAAKVCRKAAQHLEHSTEGQEMLRSRALTMETARTFNMGWLPEDVFASRPSWGLEERFHPDGKPIKLVIPAGLTLPITRGGKVVAIVVRVNRRVSICTDQKGNNRQVSGGAQIPLCLGQVTEKRKPVLVVESCLDAVLAWQEAGDLVNVMALTGASKWPDRTADGWLRSAPQVLVSLDYDETGGNRTAAWQDAYGAMICPCYDGKDITEMHLIGETPVRVWVEDYLEDLAEGGPETVQAGAIEEKTAADDADVRGQGAASSCPAIMGEKGRIFTATLFDGAGSATMRPEASGSPAEMVELNVVKGLTHAADDGAGPATETAQVAPVPALTIEDATPEERRRYEVLGRCGECCFRSQRGPDGQRYAWNHGICTKDGKPVHYTDRCRFEG